jgi:hypothetical protein
MVDGFGQPVEEPFQRCRVGGVERGGAPGADVVPGEEAPGLRRAGPLVLRARRSATRMATAGSSKRSRPGSPAGNGRTDTDIAALADLLHETSEHHGSFEAVAPPHDWWDWYAAYMDARNSGSTPDEAAAAAGRYMADVKHVVVPAA